MTTAVELGKIPRFEKFYFAKAVSGCYDKSTLSMFDWQRGNDGFITAAGKLVLRDRKLQP